MAWSSAQMGRMARPLMRGFASDLSNVDRREHPAAGRLSPVPPCGPGEPGHGRVRVVPGGVARSCASSAAGDRHPVLVLPGFTADDRSTMPLRWFLRGQGYWTHGWSLGSNKGPTRRVVDGLGVRLAEVHERHERPVTVIGWSLGGIYARLLARRQPEMVRSVITLGSPFRMVDGDHSAAERLWQSVEHRFPVSERAEMYLPEDDKPPLSVPATAIYTRTDGVVRWYICIERAGDLRENIEVRGEPQRPGLSTRACWWRSATAWPSRRARGGRSGPRSAPPTCSPGPTCTARPPERTRGAPAERRTGRRVIATAVIQPAVARPNHGRERRRRSCAEVQLGHQPCGHLANLRLAWLLTRRLPARRCHGQHVPGDRAARRPPRRPRRPRPHGPMDRPGRPGRGSHVEPELRHLPGRAPAPAGAGLRPRRLSRAATPGHAGRRAGPPASGRGCSSAPGCGAGAGPPTAW